MDWQPIETAPKDGTRILAYSGWGRMTNLQICRWIGAPHEVWSIDGFRTMHRASHWMPLPGPPTPRPGEEER